MVLSNFFKTGNAELVLAACQVNRGHLRAEVAESNKVIRSQNVLEPVDVIVGEITSHSCRDVGIPRHVDIEHDLGVCSHQKSGVRGSFSGIVGRPNPTVGQFLADNSEFRVPLRIRTSRIHIDALFLYASDEIGYWTSFCFAQRVP